MIRPLQFTALALSLGFLILAGIHLWYHEFRAFLMSLLVSACIFDRFVASIKDDATRNNVFDDDELLSRLKSPRKGDSDENEHVEME